MTWKKCIALLCLLAAPVAVLAAEGTDASPPDTWLAAGEKLAEEVSETQKTETKTETKPAGDGPPLPLHTIEGVGGALVVPMAYLVNPGPEGTVFGKPAVSVTHLSLCSGKNLQVFAVTETFLRRIEIGYALNRFDLGSLPNAIKHLTGGAARIRRQEVYLHHFNVRGLVIEENSWNLPLPAVVVGMQAKVNGGIAGMDDSTGGLLTSIGYERRNGIDFTIHASKTIPEILFGRPLILTFGVRSSNASNIGLTGFGDECQVTVECDVATLITDNFALGYEFRQKNNPYDEAPGILGDEDDWHAIRVAYIVDDHFVIAGGWAYLGPVGNGIDSAWGIQLKYEF